MQLWTVSLPPLMLHDVEPVQVWWQSPPGHVFVHVSPVVHVYWQLPLPGHVCEHVALGGHVQIWSDPLSGLHE